LRVRMQDHGNGRARARTGLETTFKAAFGTGKDNCWHVMCYLAMAGFICSDAESDRRAG
jgi:hypothetical protein